MVNAGNGALIEVASKIWDEPRARGELVKMWLRSRDELQDQTPAEQWSNIYGPIGAAMVQLWRIGGDWPKPFAVTLLGQQIELLETPPRLLAQLNKEQARIHMDAMMLERLCAAKSWDLDKVRWQYEYGIDWALIRDMLFDERLLPAERHALLILTSGGFWSDARRWHAAMEPTGTCTHCFTEIGGDRHQLYDCGCLQWELTNNKLLGRLPDISEFPMDDPGLAPLIEMGLPPRCTIWQPEELEFAEGNIEYGFEGEFFGDGSGIHQEHKDHRVATWGLITLSKHDGDYRMSNAARGRISGWAPTVPRGELKAYNEFLRVAGPGATFIGDCKAVVDAAIHGAPTDWASSRHINADLWRDTLRLQRDHATLPKAAKVTAHRSRGAAETEGETAVRWWTGNHWADHHAKQLARQIADDSTDLKEKLRHQELAKDVMMHLAVATAWNLASRPTPAVKRKKKKPREEAEGAASEHDMRERRSGGWECRWCRGFALSAAGRRALRAKPCVGVTEGQIHPTHSVKQDHGVTWCENCGCYTSRWPRELRRPCKGTPASEAQANVRNRLLRGLPPTTAAYLVDVRAEAEHDVTTATARTMRRNPTTPASARPCGLYLRLPGGPLYRSRVENSNVLAEGMSGQDTSDQADGSSKQSDGEARAAEDHMLQPDIPSITAVPHVAPTPRRDHADDSGGSGRRRLRGKQPRLQVTTPSPSSAPPPANWCSPTAASSWSCRVSVGSGSLPCNKCSRATRLHCRGCRQSLCIECARSRLPC